MTISVLLFGGDLTKVQRALVESGHEIYLFIRRKDLGPQHLSLPYRRIVTFNDIDDIEFVWACVQAIVTGHETLRCASVDDDYNGIAWDIAMRLGVTFPLSLACIQNTKNKEAARAITNTVSVKPVNFRLASESDEIIDFVEASSCKMIVKPRHGTGSQNVFLLEPATVRSAMDLLDPDVSEWLIEEFIEGEEYSVESFSQGGRHWVAGITQKEKFPSSYIESSHLFPAVLNEATQARITAFVCDALTALELREGPAHTEILVNTDGVFFVETHARFGGDHIWELVRMVTGVDYVVLQTAFILHEHFVLPEGTEHSGFAKIQYHHFYGEGIRVASLANTAAALDSANAIEIGNLLPPGMATRPLRSSSDRSYYIIAQGESLEAVDAGIARAEKLLRYELQAGKGQP
ncbi:ATP-grasp domain-containing protein [Notoacmeibacter marinus]|uniref:ATP-grasp domain-containing protein n=1 Tax=Notoacmeibacter marinus TaxID=1876515 RepID=UPI000DF3B6A6|nr:ATP-grasp domain-containing protein [Notoacmeibacter marinus]